MRYRLQRHDGTDCSATMVPITVLRMVPIQRYRQKICISFGMNLFMGCFLNHVCTYFFRLMNMVFNIVSKVQKTR